jgi:hypothetical protein
MNARSTAVLITLSAPTRARRSNGTAASAQGYATVWRTSTSHRLSQAYAERPVSGWRVTLGAIFGAVTVAGLLSACGGTEQNAGEPNASFPVAIRSSFPARQQLAQTTNFTVSVRNTGGAAIPNVAVTVVNPKYGSAAQAFGKLLAAQAAGQPILASRSRPVWIIDRAPGPCGYSCRHRGPGGAATAYTNTWALGRLAPGRTATFRWRLTAVQAGHFTVAYAISAGLNGSAKAVVHGGAPARGRFMVLITSKPSASYVEVNGTVVHKR